MNLLIPTVLKRKSRYIRNLEDLASIKIASGDSRCLVMFSV